VEVSDAGDSVIFRISRVIITCCLTAARTCSGSNMPPDAHRSTCRIT
jgi:hypothetical protein